MTNQVINVIFQDFPVPGKEMVIPNDDGSYTVFINSRLNWETQMDAYAHAMKHITGEDFKKERTWYGCRLIIKSYCWICQQTKL